MGTCQNPKHRLQTAENRAHLSRLQGGRFCGGGHHSGLVGVAGGGVRASGPRGAASGLRAAPRGALRGDVGAAVRRGGPARVGSHPAPVAHCPMAYHLPLPRSSLCNSLPPSADPPTEGLAACHGVGWQRVGSPLRMPSQPALTAWPLACRQIPMARAAGGAPICSSGPMGSDVGDLAMQAIHFCICMHLVMPRHVEVMVMARRISMAHLAPIAA